jgi:pimeloyl-ACP methyl ester carboxylesterase
VRSVTLHAGGLVTVEHELEVPLDHARPDGDRITVFAREVADPEGLDRPFLVFLQGGPGSEAPRPTRNPTSPTWLDRALRDFRVLMVDQRGTGRSTPVGPLAGTPAEQAGYLAHFRADAIVADCELLRAALDVDRWTVLGQSFGGFCALRYLSAAPQGLREVLFTGGVPPVGRHPDEVYGTTYATMRERNRRFHAAYPHDRDRLAALLGAADAGELRLADGTPMTARWLRQVGNLLGMSDGAAKLHHLLELDPRSPAFAHDLADALPFGGRNPLYAVVHESCYADGHSTRWSAERMMPEDFREDPTLLTGEHVFSWNFDDDPALRPYRDAAHLLADHEWPRLYDPDALAACEVPAAAAVYAEDPYVDRAFSEETAALVPTMRTWVTNEYEHNGLRADGERVLDRLLAMVRGRV